MIKDNNSSNREKLVLVDGSSFLFRAYYALPPLNNSKGQATGAILGVINMLKKLEQAYKPNWMAVVFDSKEPTFRHELFASYKANRGVMPDDLVSQIKPLFELIEAFGFKLIIRPGYEADDIIGTLAIIAKRNNIFSIIATGDKDLAQLVDEDIILVNTMNDTILDIAGVINKFKVPPDKMIDYLVLTGDQVDNIPGVLNVGPKTAVKWLEQYQDLQGIIDNNNDITGKVGDNLRKAIVDFDLYKKLVTIDINLDLDVNILDLIINPKNLNKLQFLLSDLEFNSWLKDLNLTKININNPLESNLAPVDLVGIYINNNLIEIAVADKYYNIYLTETEEINKLLANSKVTKVCYDIKNTVKILENHNIKIEGLLLDIKLESYVLDSLTPFNKDGLRAKDIIAIHNDLWSKINNLEAIKDLLLNIELPLALVLKNMEQTGVLIDPVVLAKQGKIINQRLNALENKVFNLAGENFNLNSPKQLQQIFYDKLGLPVLQKTPKGQASTSEPVLQELALEFELPKVILEYRSLSKLQSTYIEKLPKTINPNTNRIHTNYNQTGTVTGRLSSSEPNLQNIPIRTEEGRSIRKAFIARERYKILSADYSQIELRILAHLSQDPNLIHGFLNNLDIHAITASEVFHVDINKVTQEQRRNAKAINFGLIYGMSDFGLAKQLKISRKEASHYMEVYFAKFPQVQDFMEYIKLIAEKNGFVETMFGRRLYLPDIKSRNFMLKKAAQRAAINAPMQGAQADLIKMAMIQLDSWIQQQASDIFMLMQVHDELIFEVPETKIDLAKTSIINIMTNVAKLSVELKVEVGVGDNWSLAH